MQKESIVRYIFIAYLSAALGYFGSELIHTPRRAWKADVNRDGIEDLIFESRDKKKAILYGSPFSKRGYISGEELSDYLNSKWRKEYEERWGEKPNYDSFHFKTKWERW